jgi:hypothetical protein
MDIKDFQAPMTLKEVLAKFVHVFEAKGKRLPIFVDVQAFAEEYPEAPDIYETPVKYLPHPRRLSLERALRRALAQEPTRTALFLVRRDRIEITTKERAGPVALLALKVRANFDKRPLADVLDELSDMTGATILIDPRLGEKARNLVTATFRSDISLEAGVKVLAEMAGLRARLYENELLFVTGTPKEGGREKQTPLPLRDRPVYLAAEDVSKWSGTTVVLDPGVEPAFFTLRRPIVSVTFRPGTSGKAAARILAAMLDLEAVPMDDAVYITLPARAEQLRRSLRAQQPAKSAPKK